MKVENKIGTKRSFLCTPVCVSSASGDPWTFEAFLEKLFFRLTIWNIGKETCRGRGRHWNCPPKKRLNTSLQNSNKNVSFSCSIFERKKIKLKLICFSGSLDHYSLTLSLYKSITPVAMFLKKFLWWKGKGLHDLLYCCHISSSCYFSIQLDWNLAACVR